MPHEADIHRKSALFTLLVLAAQGHQQGRPRWREKFRRLLPFSVTRRAARSLGFSKPEWDEWVADGKAAPSLGPYMPSAPEQMYPDEWAGWDDFLGVIRSYEEAKEEVRKFGISTQQEWWDFVANDSDVLAELRLPARPHLHYPNCGQKWLGYDDWLSQPQEVWYVPFGTHIDDDGYPGATG